MNHRIERETEFHAERRRFLRTVGAAGAVGVAGCVGDDENGTSGENGDGENDENGDEDGTGGDDEDASHEETYLLEEVSYGYYEGDWDGFPDFAERTPDDEGTLDEISLSARERDVDFAFRFEGDLLVGDHLEPGTYSFALESAGDARLSIDGSVVLDIDGGTEDDATARLDAGTNALQLDYVAAGSEPLLGLGWRGVYDELLPRISEYDPLRAGDEFAFEIEVRCRPEVAQLRLPDTAVRSVAVGLPNAANCVFDTTTGAVRYAWFGAFLEYGEMVGYGEGRGDHEPVAVLGDRFSVEGVDHPLRVGDPDSVPEIEFLGYREAPYPPALRYRVDDHRVEQAIEKPPEGAGLRYTFSFPDEPSEPVYFHTADEELDRSASDGEWDGAVLEVPADVSEFSVTVIGGDR